MVHIKPCETFTPLAFAVGVFRTCVITARQISIDADTELRALLHHNTRARLQVLGVVTTW